MSATPIPHTLAGVRRLRYSVAALVVAICISAALTLMLNIPAIVSIGFSVVATMLFFAILGYRTKA